MDKWPAPIEEIMKYIFLVLFLISAIACTKKPETSKRAFVQDYYHKHKAHMSKTRGYLNVSVVEKDRDDTSIRLIATVSPHRDFAGSEIHWQLPENAIILNGDKDLETDLVKEQDQSFELTLDRNSLKDGEKIFVFAYKNVNGERLGTSSLIVYKENPEATLEVQSKTSNKKNLIQ